MSVDAADPKQAEGADASSSGLPGVLKSPFFWAFIVGALLITAYRPLANSMRTAPPPLIEVGAWTLQDQTGAAFGSEQLAGHVYVADFFFTRCPSICKELTQTMVRVQESLARHGDKVHLVSFSVDPDFDSPEVLKAYGEKYKADFSRWHFVTGAKKDVVDLVAKRMKFHVGEKEPLQEDLYEISHTGKLVLFDQEGNIRALFSTDQESLSALGNATALLVDQGPDA